MKKTVLAAASLFFAISAFAGDGLPKVTPAEVGMDAKRLEMVDGVFKDAIEDHTIPGAVVAVVRHGKIAYMKAYGNKSLVPKVEKMTTETMFDLASCSKCVGTTLSFMQLIEDGKVRLTDNVDQYIPNFQPWVDPQTGEKVDITVEQLLTHSSGLLPYVNANFFVREYGANTPDKLIEYIATKVTRSFRPGTDFQYSCLNFITLQNILQNVTGERLCDYAQKNVFDALGLKHTCYFPLVGEPSVKNEAALKKLVAPTEVQADGLPLVAQVHDPLARLVNSGNSGNAGVFSCAEDLCKVVACLMNGGELDGKRILSPLTVKTMFTVPTDIDPSVGRGLGWDCYSSYAGPRGDLLSRTSCFLHTGYTGPSIVMDLENDVAVIILAHRVHPEDKGGMGRVRALTANIVASSIMDL